MRMLWLSGALCVSAALIAAGCPSQPTRQSWLEQFSPPPGTEPLETNPRAAQSLANVADRLSSEFFQQTMTTTSAGGSVTNIEEPPTDWQFQNLYVGGGNNGSDFDSWTDPLDDLGPPPGGGDDAPTSRDAHTFAGVVTGTDYEGIVGCCDAIWNVSESASVAFNENDELTQVFMPAFALLPDYILWVSAPGETQVYSGTITTSPPIEWTYRVTTRTVTQTDDRFIAIFDLVVEAESGSLTESGTCVHQVEGTQSGGSLHWSSTTDYEIHMHASGPGQPDVELDTFQQWTLDGSLAPR